MWRREIRRQRRQGPYPCGSGLSLSGELCATSSYLSDFFFSPKQKCKFVFQVLPNVTSMLTVPGSVNSVARYNQGPASDDWADPQSLIPGCSVFVGWTSGGCIFVFMYLHA